MRSALLVGAVLALAALAASPPEKHDSAAAVAAHAPDSVAPSLAVAPVLAALEVAPAEHATQLEGFNALKPSTEIVASPEVLAGPGPCSSRMAPFQPQELELAYVPQLRAPPWRFIGPNSESNRAVNVSRG